MFGSKITALFFFLIILISVEKKIRLRLTDIPWSFPGKLMISTKPRPSQNYSLLNRLSCWKVVVFCRTEEFSFYIIGEMFRTNGLFVDSVAS